MEDIRSVISRHPLNSNSSSNRTEIDKSSIANAIAIEDKILDSVADLTAEQYRAWYVVRLRDIGPTKFIECADRARKYGRDPKKLFSTLIKGK